MMIAGGLLLLVMGLAVASFVSFRRYTQRVTLRLDMQTISLKTLSLISQELSEANPFTVDYHTPGALIFPAPRSVAGDVSVDPTSGDLRWASVVCYRIVTEDDESRLVRLVDVLPDLEVPPEPAEEGFDLAHFESAGLKARTVNPYGSALNVERELDSTSELSKSFTVTMTTRKKIHGVLLELDAKTSVLCRN